MRIFSSTLLFMTALGSVCALVSVDVELDSIVCSRSHLRQPIAHETATKRDTRHETLTYDCIATLTLTHPIRSRAQCTCIAVTRSNKQMSSKQASKEKCTKMWKHKQKLIATKTTSVGKKERNIYGRVILSDAVCSGKSKVTATTTPTTAMPHSVEGCVFKRIKQKRKKKL